MAHQEHNPSTESYLLPAETWTKVRNSLAFVTLIGWAGTATAFALQREQFYFSYLVAFLFFVSIGLGALFFVMISHLSGSVWSVTVRRLMETVMRTIPLGMLLFVPLLFGLPVLYEWARPEAAHDPTLIQKLSYLNEHSFVQRGFIAIGVWSLFALILYRTSRAQDQAGGIALTKRAVKWSAPGVLVLFLSASMAAFDWIMSLNPHWWSTMFGVYYLSGSAVAFMAVLICICLGLRSAGYLRHSITEEHYHDLGKWLFALTVFWAYIAFSQYMLIWYGNLPEETFYFKYRLVGSWFYFRPLLIFGNFFIPFFILISRRSKRNYKLLAWMAGWLLLMHLADLHWQVMPVFHKTGFSPSWVDVAALVAIGGSYSLLFWSGLREKPLIPIGDPRLEQCLGFHNA
jgi:hypothetical protein